MVRHESEGMAFKDSGLETTEKPLAAKISPKFAELTADLDEVMRNSNDPKLIGALLFKLAEEREQTNKLIESIAENNKAMHNAVLEKYDNIMFELKTRQFRESTAQELQQPQHGHVLLPEQDRAILHFIGERGKATAFDIQAILNYKGINGASQRLNKLTKEGYLQKVRSGKRMLYLAKV